MSKCMVLATSCTSGYATLLSLSLLCSNIAFLLALLCYQCWLPAPLLLLASRLLVALGPLKGPWSGGTTSDTSSQFPEAAGSITTVFKGLCCLQTCWKTLKCSVTCVLAACCFCWLFWKLLVMNYFRIPFPFSMKNIPITSTHIFPFKKEVGTERGIAFY